MLEVEAGQTLEAKAALEEAHREMDRLRRDLQDQLRSMQVGEPCPEPGSCLVCMLAKGHLFLEPDGCLLKTATLFTLAPGLQRELDRRDERIRKLELQLRGAYRWEQKRHTSCMLLSIHTLGHGPAAAIPHAPNQPAPLCHAHAYPQWHQPRAALQPPARQPRHRLARRHVRAG